MKTLTIYFTKDKKNFQIIRPSEAFKGDWAGLVDSITGGRHEYYVIS